MRNNNTFFRTICAIAVPAALQSMLQSSFSIVDQIMIGQLGSVHVAAVGLAGKFTGIYSVLVSAVGAVAGIMISQYLGQKNPKEVRRSFSMNLLLALCIAGLFTLVCVTIPGWIMGLYIQDGATIDTAASYLRIVAWTFLPMAGATMLATMFRCVEKASLPLYASFFAAIVNTGLNYVLIFGKLGLPAMGADGAAIATLLSQVVNFVVMLVMMLRTRDLPEAGDGTCAAFNWSQYAAMLLPILACELLWSLGENVYAGIYGRLGTESSAAMTLTNPIQGLMIGGLCGLSQAASVIIGKRLGAYEYDAAYSDSKKLILAGLLGSLVLSVVVLLTRNLYVQIYNVEPNTKALTSQILVAYALVAPFKVSNMILGGGIIRSGGKTNYVMVIDTIGTWGFGVPLGILASQVWGLSIPYVYFILSLEECVRFAISLVVFWRKGWMQSLGA